MNERFEMFLVSGSAGYLFYRPGDFYPPPAVGRKVTCLESAENSTDTDKPGGAKANRAPVFRPRPRTVAARPPASRHRAPEWSLARPRTSARPRPAHELGVVPGAGVHYSSAGQRSAHLRTAGAST